MSCEDVRRDVRGRGCEERSAKSEIACEEGMTIHVSSRVIEDC